MGIDIIRGTIEGSREDGLAYGPRYSWAVEQLAKCNEVQNSASVVSGNNPISRAFLWLASSPGDRAVVHKRFLDQTHLGVQSEWLKPWQQSLCDSLDIEALVDPVAAGMRPEGGEGETLLDQFPAIFQLFEITKRGKDDKPPYADSELRKLVLDEISSQRESLSSEQIKLTSLLQLTIDYDQQFDARTELKPREIEEHNIIFGYTTRVPVGPKIPQLSISGLFLRAIYIRSAAKVWVEFTSRTNEKVGGEALFAGLESAAATLRSDFRTAWRFTLAHELAHVYLGNSDWLETNEFLVDCAAILQISKHDPAGDGAYGLIEKAYEERVQDYFGLLPQDREEFEMRRRSFRQIADDVKTARGKPLSLEYCDRYKSK